MPRVFIAEWLPTVQRLSSGRLHTKWVKGLNFYDNDRTVEDASDSNHVAVLGGAVGGWVAGCGGRGQRTTSRSLIGRRPQLLYCAQLGNTLGRASYEPTTERQ